MKNWTPQAIRELILDRDETREQFAYEMRVSVNAVYRWLAGSRRPRPRQIRQLDRLKLEQESKQ